MGYIEIDRSMGYIWILDQGVCGHGGADFVESGRSALLIRESDSFSLFRLVFWTNAAT